MKTFLDCIPCFLRQSLEAAREVTSDIRVHEQILQEVLHMLQDLDRQQSPPFVAQIIHRRLRSMTGSKDPYCVIKSRLNQMAMAALPLLGDRVRQAPNPMLAAVRYAIAANALDVGACPTMNEADVLRALDGSVSEPLQGDFARLQREVAKARRILYLADNCGELVVDRLLIETLGPERVTLVVRGGPVLNDATMADVREVGMQDLVKVMDNGSDAPGTILTDCSPLFRQEFEQADLIIAKGQGNYESQSEVQANIIFLLKVKCPVLSRHLELPLGAHALLFSTSPVRGPMI